VVDHVVTLTTDQLHDIVGGMFKRGKDAPLELATSTMFNVAEELRLLSSAATHGGGDNSTDVGNVLHALSERLETMANLCDDLGKEAQAANG
jgi:hypothetical protein